MSCTRTEVVALLGEGLSMAEVARRTGLAHSTVSYHRDRHLHEAEGLRTTAEGCLAPRSNSQTRARS